MKQMYALCRRYSIACFSVFSFVFLMSASLTITAQTANLYTFSTSTGATLDPMTGATTAIGTSIDDTPSGVLNIGFSFTYEGTAYTQFSVTPDGFMKLGSVAAVSQFSNAVTSTTNIPKLFPYWDDMATGTTGNVTYVTTGTAPNRKLVVQWFVTIPRATAGAANSTFQVWLYETTNVIEFRYGTLGTAVMSASVGINGTTATNYHSITVSTNTSSTTLANNTNGGQPASGRMYSFNPPAPCTGAPLAGTVSPTTMTVTACSGAGAVTPITTSGITSGFSGLSYQWQQSTDGITGWANAVGGIGSTTSTYTPPGSVGTLYYRMRTICSTGPDTSYTSNTCEVIGTITCSYDVTYTTGASWSSIMPANGGSGTVMPGWTSATSGDDNTSTAVSLTGTTFQYQNAPVTGFRVCSNGWMTFNTAITATTFSNALGSTTQTQVLAPFWDDLVFTGQVYANRDNCVRYQVVGTLGSGSAVIIIEWAGMERFNVTGPNLNFQVRLYEAGNVIEYVYGNFEAFDGSVATAWSYSLGYNGTSPAGTGSFDRFALQTGQTNHFSSASDPANIALTPTCYSKYTFTIGTYTGPTTTPATPVPSNDNSSGATALAINTSECVTPNLCGTYYTSRGATDSGFGSASCASLTTNQDDDVWFTFTTTGVTDYTIKVKPSPGYDPLIQLLDGSFAQVQCTDAVGTTTSSTVTGIETMALTGLTPFSTYYIRVYHDAAGSGTTGGFSLCLYQTTPPPVNDNCATPTSLTVGTSCTYTSGSTLTATASADVVCTGTADDDVWYSFVATDAAPVITVQSGVGFNAVLALYSGTCGALTNITCTNSTTTGGIETYNASGLTIGETYYIRIYHFATGAGTGSFQVCVYNPVPSCTSGYSPADLTTEVSPGGVTLSWSAATYASSYDVYFDTNPVPAFLINTTSTSLATGPLVAGTTYYWQIIPKNATGSATGCSVQSFTTQADCSVIAHSSTVSTANPVCATIGFTLSLSASTLGAGISYQWQSSADDITYVDISGATASTLATSQTAATYFRCIVSCSFSATSDTSDALLVDLNPATACYCIPTSSGSACITNVTIDALNNTTTGCEVGNYSLQSATTTLTAGGTYTFSVTTDASAITSVWFDFNQDGIFDASEWYQPFTTGTIDSVSVTVPGSAVIGTTGMRVRSRLAGNTNGEGDACTPFGSGECEDYFITIAPGADCAGIPTAGTATSTVSTICGSGTTNLSLTGGLAEGGLTYQWQESADDVSYADISGATTVPYTTGTISTNTYYRCIVTCSFTSLSDTSSSVLVSVSASPLGDTQSNPVVISSLPYTVTGNNLASNCFTNNIGNLAPDVYYQYTALCNGTLSVGVCPQADMNDSYVRLLDGTGTELTFNDDTEPVGCTFTFGSSITWPIVAGETYYIVVEGFSSNQGNYDLSVSETSSFSTFYADSDGDTYGDPLSTVDVCDGIAPSGYVGNSLDCDDADAAVNPTATEVCDGIDNNCDGLTDDDDPTVIGQSTWYVDVDGDGFGDANDLTGTLSCFGGPGLSPDNSDCDDADAAINPGATEVCNGYDDNCDGFADDADPGITGQPTWYADADGDTYGDPATAVLACDQPVGYIADGFDCDDTNSSVNPAATEVCNGIDDDCDALTDDADPSITGQSTWYADTDGDTYGDASSTTLACMMPSGYVADDTDCDDGDASVNPAGTEVCNGVDDDCNGSVDDGIPYYTYYLDNDGDTYGDVSSTISICDDAAPTGYSYTGDDCDDNDAAVNPGATEVCNGIDDNCDGNIDESLITAAITYTGSLSICKGQFVTLSANAGVGYTYQWFKNGVPIPGGTGVDYDATKAGIYTVQVNIPGGCFDLSDGVAVIRLLSPNNNISAPNGLDLCLSTVKLKASYQPGSTHQWFKDDVAIVGATGFIYIATTTGDYRCEITYTATGCMRSTERLTVISSCHLGINTQVDLQVYPNPMSGEFTLYLNSGNSISSEFVRVDIYNVVGDLVYSDLLSISGGILEEQISLENSIPSGMYTVKVSDNNEQFIKQVVLQR